MSECHRTKILLEGTMIVFKTKGPQVHCLPHGSFGLSQCKSSWKKKHAGWQNLKTWINSKKKILKYVAFLTGGEVWRNVNRPAKNTLVWYKFWEYNPIALINYRLKINSQRKTLALSREANTLPHCKWSCKEQAGSDKNLSVKPYSFISCCFKRNL